MNNISISLSYQPNYIEINRPYWTLQSWYHSNSSTLTSHGSIKFSKYYVSINNPWFESSHKEQYMLIYHDPYSSRQLLTSASSPSAFQQIAGTGWRAQPGDQGHQAKLAVTWVIISISKWLVTMVREPFTNGIDHLCYGC